MIDFSNYMAGFKKHFLATEPLQERVDKLKELLDKCDCPVEFHKVLPCGCSEPLDEEPLGDITQLYNRCSPQTGQCPKCKKLGEDQYCYKQYVCTTVQGVV